MYSGPKEPGKDVAHVRVEQLDNGRYEFKLLTVDGKDVSQVSDWYTAHKKETRQHWFCLDFRPGTHTLGWHFIFQDNGYIRTDHTPLPGNRVRLTDWYIAGHGVVTHSWSGEKAIDVASGGKYFFHIDHSGVDELDAPKPSLSPDGGEWY